MLRHLAERGDARMRALALRTLVQSARLRGRREILGTLPVATPAGEERRTIYDARHTSSLPGMLVRGEGDPPASDPTVNEAYDGLGATYQFYHDIFDRNSIDNKGMRLDATVHYEVDYDNAFWDGQQMVFGDGDGTLFVGFTKSLDVIGHELTHGVTQFDAGLEYHDQPGALNESISDVFGSLVKQYALKQDVRQADWLIGQGILGPNIHGEALRSMKAPGTAYDDPTLGKDPQPSTMKGYVKTSEDNGGVHINSGIPNHAFYLAAMAIGGYAWEETGKIWYTALRRFQPITDFQEAANITSQAAGEIFGTGSSEQQSVRDAWAQVGIKVAGVRAPRRVAKHAPAETNGELAKELENVVEELQNVAAVLTHAVAH
jgi:Zn-dependent metalloprotease